MKTTFRIAKLELNTLFYSPIAWFLAIVFLFQCAFAYTDLVGDYMRLQGLGGENLVYLINITSKIFSDPWGIYTTIISKIYLYLPLITMGLISREVGSGTIKLLYSSPIKVKQIVLGKFIAMVAYSLVMIMALVIMVIAGLFNIPHADIGAMLSGLLGVFLLLCAYSAIGLFMSSLTSYQIVAAISTLVVFAILDFVGNLWQGIDFVRNLTYFLSIYGRTDHMVTGLISTKDVIYFTLITFMFLLFSIIKLQADRETKSWLKVAGRYLAVFLVALVIGYISDLPQFIFYYDATANKKNTLTVNTQKVLKQIGDEQIEVTFYDNLLDDHFRFGSPEARNEDFDRWAKYLRFKPNIKLNYVYYYAAPLDANSKLVKYYPGKTPKQIAQQFADTYNLNLKDFKTPEEIKKIIDLSGEQYRSVMQVKFRGKTTFLRLFNDQMVVPSEVEIAAAFKRLTVQLPKLGFLNGQYERSIDRMGPQDFGTMASDITYRYSLVNQGFDCLSISLKNQEIPKDLAALVIVDPRAAFTPQELAKIQQYIAGGGNLLIAGEGEKKDILEPILHPLGVAIIDGTLLQTSKDFSMNSVKVLLTPDAARLSGVLVQNYADSIGVNMLGAAGLSYNTGGAFTIKPLLITDERNTWNKKGKVVLDSAALEYSPADGDTHGPVSPLLALTRHVNGKEQRIIVAGDADFLTPAASNRNETSNFFFAVQLYRWLTYGQFPIDASRPPFKDNGLNLTRDGTSQIRIFLLWILPGLLTVFAVIFLVRRKRK